MIKKRIRSSMIAYKGNVKGWRNALCGTPAFIIGNAPSLINLDLSCLRYQFTIGINRSFPPYIDLDPTILMWQDPETWYSEKQYIPKLNAIKYCRNTADIQGRFFHFKLSGGAFELPEDPSILHGRGASGPLAFQLAYSLGCDPIVLVGMDCQYKNNKTNMYGKNQYHSKHTLTNCQRGLSWIKNCNSNREVISCSEDTVFNSKPLKKVVQSLPMKKPKDRDSLNATLLSAANC